MKKVFVLDTNVVLSDPEAIFKFQEHTVVIPLPVVKEVDKFKKNSDELGRNARAFSRHIDQLRKQGFLCWDENFTFGDNVPIIVNERGGKLKVIPYLDCYGDMLCGCDMSEPDNQILACALSIDTSEVSKTILVTKDTNLRILGDVYGVEAQDYENEKVDVEELYTGCERHWVTADVISEIYATGRVGIDCIGPYEDYDYPHIGMILVNEMDEKNSALCVYDPIMKDLVLLADDQTTLGITPRNAEQKFALNLLTNPDIHLVTMTGKAGSGKTLMALLGGLNGVIERELYERMVLLKPIIAMDNAHELGFLPGDMDEKLKPWMASYSDNLAVIMGKMTKEELKITTKKLGKKPKKLTKAEQAELDVMEEKDAGRLTAIDELKALGLVECGSLEHIRGRSRNNVYIIIDEAQNLSKHAVKTIVTRAGEGTKIILMGDIGQIDSPFLDASNNGLTNLIDKFATQEIAGHITMKKSERSKLAEIAANIL